LLCNLVSDNLETGFLIINISIFVIGINSWVYISRRKNFTAQILVWLFIIIEFINGIGHPIWALSEMDYVPGLISALILLPLDLYLIIQILKQPDNKSIQN
jgi:xanthine/uracil permease